MQIKVNSVYCHDRNIVFFGGIGSLLRNNLSGEEVQTIILVHKVFNIPMLEIIVITIKFEV